MSRTTYRLVIERSEGLPPSIEVLDEEDNAVAGDALTEVCFEVLQLIERNIMRQPTKLWVRAPSCACGCDAGSGCDPGCGCACGGGCGE